MTTPQIKTCAQCGRVLVRRMYSGSDRTCKDCRRAEHHDRESGRHARLAQAIRERVTVNTKGATA